MFGADGKKLYREESLFIARRRNADGKYAWRGEQGSKVSFQVIADCYDQTLPLRTRARHISVKWKDRRARRRSEQHDCLHDCLTKRMT